MTLTPTQQSDLDALIQAGQSKITETVTSQKTNSESIRRLVMDAYGITTSLEEFVSSDTIHYEYGSQYLWLRIPNLLPIKLFFGHSDYNPGQIYTTGCYVVREDREFSWPTLPEALAGAVKLAAEEVPPHPMKIDEDTLLEAYDRWEEAIDDVARSLNETPAEINLKLAEMRVKRLRDVMNFRTKQALLSRETA